MYTHNVPINRNEDKCHIDCYQHISSDMPGIDSAQKQIGPSASSVAQNTELKYSCGLASYIVTNTSLLEV